MGWWKRRTLSSPAVATVLQVDRCELCSAEICGSAVCALVAAGLAADASIHERRLVTACSTEHLAALLAGARI